MLFLGKLEINEKRYNLMLTYEDGSAIIANVADEHSDRHITDFKNDLKLC